MSSEKPAMDESPSGIIGVAAGSDSKDGGGLRRVATAARENSRGPYRCKKCGQRHGEGNACGSASGVAPRRNRPASGSAPAPTAPAAPLFNKENTKRLVRVPFAVAAIRTHCPHLALDEQQEEELATSGSVVLNEWVAVDPKYVALGLFSISLLGVVFEKVLVYSMWVKAQEIELEKMKIQAQASQRNQAPVKSPEDNPAPPAAPAAAAFTAKEAPPPPRTT